MQRDTAPHQQKPCRERNPPRRYGGITPKINLGRKIALRAVYLKSIVLRWGRERLACFEFCTNNYRKGYSLFGADASFYDFKNIILLFFLVGPDLRPSCSDPVTGPIAKIHLRFVKNQSPKNDKRGEQAKFRFYTIKTGELSPVQHPNRREQAKFRLYMIGTGEFSPVRHLNRREQARFRLFFSVCLRHTTKIYSFT